MKAIKQTKKYEVVMGKLHGLGRKEVADHGGKRGRALQPLTREA